MKIIAKTTPGFNKIYRNWLTNYDDSYDFDFWIKNRYNLDITRNDDICMWEDESFVFESEEEYFLYLLRWL